MAKARESDRFCALRRPTVHLKAVSVNPSVVYTPEQTALCAPDRHTDTRKACKKSRVGEGVTATPTTHIVAPAGRAIDPRSEARDHRNDGIYVVETTLTSGSLRGSSLRMGRTAEVRPIIAGYTINATAACYEALGLFSARS